MSTTQHTQLGLLTNLDKLVAVEEALKLTRASPTDPVFPDEYFSAGYEYARAALASAQAQPSLTPMCVTDAMILAALKAAGFHITILSIKDMRAALEAALSTQAAQHEQAETSRDLYMMERGAQQERERIRGKQTEQPVQARGVPREWRSALRKVVFMARTSGGTTGPDSGLMAALSEAEALLSRPYLLAAAPQQAQVSDGYWKYSVADLRSLADEKSPFFEGKARQALIWAANVLVAADEAVSSAPQQAEPLSDEQVAEWFGRWSCNPADAAWLVQTPLERGKRTYIEAFRDAEKACAESWGVKLGGIKGAK